MNGGPMIDLAHQLNVIADAPTGPDTVAFFDLDGTLINGFSAKAVFLERLKTLDVTVHELWEISSAVVEMRMRNSPVDNLMGKAVKGLEGRREEDLMEQAYTLFRNEIAPMIYPQARVLVEAHRHAGHRLVIATSATPYQAIPVKEDLQFDELLCTTPVVVDGVLTGELVGNSLWGPRKAQAVADYAERENVDLAGCFGYSNGGEDVPFLDEVGHPVALNPDDDLKRYAAKVDWPTLVLENPKRGTDLTSAIRSTAALGSVLASAGFGLGLGLLTGSRRTGANITSTIAPDIALTIAGIKLDVTGTENAWSARPAVFLFNHQSTADSIIVTSILRRDITAVAKRELERDPRFALLGRIFDVAYIDRGDPAQAREAMKPAIEKLHSGISVAIAPEGTRMPTPRLGRFKKGAFHLAMQAGVPIVPIVIHNAGDVMWKKDFTAHSGTVKVTVGEPIATADWVPDKIDSYIDDVRSFYDRTLDMPEDKINSVVQSEIEKNLLGGTPKYTRTDIVEKSGIAPERVTQLWIAMGFPVHTDPAAIVYTDADLEALRMITGLTEQGVIRPEMEVAIARTLGQTMSRLTEWQVGVVNSHMHDRVTEGADPADLEAIRRDARAVAAQTVPTLEALQSYTWRRHLAATAGRSIADPGEETTSRTLAVGFADMVGYTSLTRRLAIDELTELLEEFESIATNIIARGRGSVIKNVGDEVMFSAQTPEDAAHIALDLQDAFAAKEDMPELRVGIAWGPVLARYGDLYGSVVNMAARLTSSAHPGTILVDTTMTDALANDSEFYLKSLRSLRVRGFHKLKPHALRRNKRESSRSRGSEESTDT